MASCIGPACETSGSFIPNIFMAAKSLFDDTKNSMAQGDGQCKHVQTMCGSAYVHEIHTYVCIYTHTESSFSFYTFSLYATQIVSVFVTLDDNLLKRLHDLLFLTHCENLGAEDLVGYSLSPSTSHLL